MFFFALIDGRPFGRAAFCSTFCQFFNEPVFAQKIAKHYQFFANSVFSGNRQSVFLLPSTGRAVIFVQHFFRSRLIFNGLFRVYKFGIFDERWRVVCEKIRVFPVSFPDSRLPSIHFTWTNEHPCSSLQCNSAFVNCVRKFWHRSLWAKFWVFGCIVVKIFAS